MCKSCYFNEIVLFIFVRMGRLCAHMVKITYDMSVGLLTQQRRLNNTQYFFKFGALVQIMACGLVGAKPLSEPMLVLLHFMDYFTGVIRGTYWEPLNWKPGKGNRRTFSRRTWCFISVAYDTSRLLVSVILLLLQETSTKYPQSVFKETRNFYIKKEFLVGKSVETCTLPCYVIYNKFYAYHERFTAACYKKSLFTDNTFKWVIRQHNH